MLSLFEKTKESQGCRTGRPLLDELQVVQNAAPGVHVHLHALQVGVQDGDQPGEHAFLRGAGHGQAGALWGGLWAGRRGTGQGGPYLAVDDGVDGHERVLLRRWLRPARGLAAAVHHGIATCWRGAGHVSHR